MPLHTHAAFLPGFSVKPWRQRIFVVCLRWAQGGTHRPGLAGLQEAHTNRHTGRVQLQSSAGPDVRLHQWSPAVKVHLAKLGLEASI